MQPSLNSFAVLRHPSPGAAGASRTQAIDDRPAGLVESAELLKGQKTVGIMHDGSLYRLQATKLGKLILTK